MEQIKTCSRCKEPKSLKDFAFKNKLKGIRTHNCRSCHRLYVKAHYLTNKAYYLQKARTNARKNIDKFNNYKRTLSCSDCKMSFEKHPFLCDFHHIDPSTKTDNLVSFKTKSWIKIMAEIAKCVPLCANCHRIRHYELQF